VSQGQEVELGYAFALPRLVARLGGRKVRRAEFSRLEAYGVCFLVFGISNLFVARALLPLLGSLVLQWLVGFLLPFAMWAAFLLLYYLVSLVIAVFRRLEFYRAPTNTSFQHVVIMTLTTGLAFALVRDDCDGVRSLGFLWLGLLGLNLLAIAILGFFLKE
jgi:hypothetical protein